jgi:hypothetical protein
MNKIIQVKWIDSNCEYGWRDKCDLPLEANVVTIGYLIDKNVDVLVVAQSISGDNIQNPLAIPIECIKDIEIIPETQQWRCE